MFRYPRERKPRQRPPVSQVASDLSNVTRAALILYTVEYADTTEPPHTNEQPAGTASSTHMGPDETEKRDTQVTVTKHSGATQSSIAEHPTPRVYALFGRGSAGLTSLGGRTNLHENWLDCLVRELKEETRDVLDYSLCKDMFLTSPTQAINFNNCAYVFYPTSLETLRGISEAFPKTSSNRSVCNEMLSLEVIDIDTLIINLVESHSPPRVSPNRVSSLLQEEGIVTPSKTSLSTGGTACSAAVSCASLETPIVRMGDYSCAPVFQSMFMSVGYDVLKSNARESQWNHTFVGRNFTTQNVNVEVELTKPIREIPPIVCLTPINHGLPVIYGTAGGLFITDQFYLEEKGRRLFRSGWYSIS